MFGAFFIALISAVFAISFAAIIYKGELAPYLDRGIGMTLLGSVVIAVTGAFTLSYRGTILAPQDVPAILLAGAAATIVATGELAGEALFATVACLVAVSSLATGLAGVVVGQMKLAYVARFVPYPVLAGFLAATGLLLVTGGLGVGVGDINTTGGWAVYLAPDVVFKWMPSLIAALAILVLTRMIKSNVTLPVALTVTALGFYVMLWLFGISLQQARSDGLLLGPFSEAGLLDGIGPQLVTQADWLAIASQAPVILAIIASCMLGATLNASGLELTFRRDFDISKEVKGAGLANLLGGLVGTIPGYHIVAETILANRLGLLGPLAGISSGLGSAAVLLLGANVLSGLPIGLFAAVLIFLGIDLLYTWLWEERRRLGAFDYAIVVLIPIIAITFGFLTAIATGLLLACAIFIVSYAKLDLIRSRSDLSVRRSRVERPDRELRILSDTGKAVKVIELSGFLFFGSANALREKMQKIITSPKTKVECLILDFGHATGIDVSTLRVLARLVTDCGDRDVKLVLTGLATDTLTELRDVLAVHDVEFFDNLYAALEHIEDLVIEHHANTVNADQNALIDRIEGLLSEEDMERLELATGTSLVETDARSDDIYLLCSGELAVSVTTRDGKTITVAKVRAGSVIGEMAYYSGNARSADIVARTPSVILRISMNRMRELEATRPAAALAFHKEIAGNMARRLDRTTKLLRDLGG
jgi:SulP family sulfate permease